MYPYAEFIVVQIVIDAIHDTPSLFEADNGVTKEPRT